MILELDCGNSFIKWRMIRANGASLVTGGVVGADQELLDAVAAAGGGGDALCHCRLVSVRTPAETSALVDAIFERFGVRAICAEPAQALAGVRNGYEEYQRLGLDRWLAVLGAFHMAGTACLVLDLGTAATSDFIEADGQHLGGFICPGMPLMRSQLRTHTRRIRYDDESAEQAVDALLPGKNTVEAVERGCTLMLRGFVLTQLEQAQVRWGRDHQVFLTGGDAEVVRDVVPGARVVPDLVFIGLAIACPLS
jgi:type III pantothenate kinase